MGFLNSLRILRRHVEKKIDLAGERAAGFPRKSSNICTACPASFHAAHHVRAGAAGGKRDEDILRSDKRFDLTGENTLEAKVVAGRGENGWVGGQRQRREATTIGAQPHDKFSGKMQRVGGASAITEKDDFSATTERSRAFFRKLADASDELVGKAVLNASAFLELASDLFGG